MKVRYLWATLIVWAILFLLIRFTFNFGVHPLFSFLLLIVLFFVALFLVRVSVLKLRAGWSGLKNVFRRYTLPRRK
jgi:hypothetical protein